MIIKINLKIYFRTIKYKEYKEDIPVTGNHILAHYDKRFF